MTVIYPQTPEGQPGSQISSPMVRLQRVLVTFIRGLFAQLPRGAYHWEQSEGTAQDQEGSEIWIGTEQPINPNTVGRHPAISVGRGPAAFHGIGLGDQAFYDQATGAYVKMDMIPTTSNINILSRVPFEAEELAWFVANHVWLLRSEIMRGNDDFIMYLGQRPSLSPPAPAGTLVPDGETDWMVVTISMPVYLQHMAVAMPLNKKVVREFRTVATATGPQQKLRPRRALVGTAVFSEAPGTLPQKDGSEAQSSEPLTFPFKTT